MHDFRRKVLRRLPKTLSLAAALAGVIFVAAVNAAITPSGDVAPVPIMPNTTIQVANQGIGSLVIDGGSTLTSSFLQLGQGSNGVGTVIVRDPGSLWRVSGAEIGNAGIGRLEVRNGGTFEVPAGANLLRLGNNQAAQGTIVVEDPRSVLQVVAPFSIGQQGTALLRVAGGGLANVPEDTTIVGAGGRVELDDGLLRTNMLTNNGTIVGSGEVAVLAASTVNNNGRIEAGPGDRLVVGGAAGGNVMNNGALAADGGELELRRMVTNLALSGSTGRITLRDATLRLTLAGTTQPGLQNTSLLAALGGENHVHGRILNTTTGQIVATNQSTAIFHHDVGSQGTITVAAGSTAIFLEDLLMQGGTLQADLGGAQGFGRAEVYGTAQLSGNLLISLSGGFAPLAGDQFTVLKSADLGGTQFDAVTATNAGGLQFFPIYSPTDVTVFTAVEGEKTWGVDAGGQVSVGANWFGGMAPAGASEAVALSTTITADRTIEVNVSLSLRRLRIDDDNRYTIAGPQAITFDSADAAPATILVQNLHGNGAHAISAPVVLADDLAIEQQSGGALVLAGPLNNAAGRRITKTGAGTLTIAGAQSHGAGAALTIAAGTVNLNTNAGNSAVRNATITANSTTYFGSTQHLAALNIGAGATATVTPGSAKNLITNALAIAGAGTSTGKLDLTTNGAIVDYVAGTTNPEATIRAQIASGRGGSGLGKTWNGHGITSSAAAASAVTDPESRSVGYADNASLPLGPYSNFRGEPVDATSILMGFTRTGDANLDGVVNDDDVTIVGAAYAPGVSQPFWALGDFDYNGFVDDDDVTLLGAFYDPSAPPIAAAAKVGDAQVAAVPEPGANVLLIAGVILTTLVTLAAHRKRAGSTYKT